MALSWWSDDVRKEMAQLTASQGLIQSYKMFLAYNGVLRLHDHELLQAFQVCKEIGALAQVHAENGDMVEDGQSRVFKAGVHGPEGHALSRPEATEAEATFRAIALADQVNVPLYVVHVMSKAASRVIAQAKSEGARGCSLHGRAQDGCTDASHGQGKSCGASLLLWDWPVMAARCGIQTGATLPGLS
jgi:dihydropyrimidinase